MIPHDRSHLDFQTGEKFQIANNNNNNIKKNKRQTRSKKKQNKITNIIRTLINFGVLRNRVGRRRTTVRRRKKR